MAAGAEYIINSAKIYANFTEAMADINIAYATTARPRDMNKRVVTPEIALKEIAGLYAPPSPNLPQKEREFLRAALVFGPERAGMENWEITLCDSIITIPTGEKNRSLNLAQSAVIIGYEWQKASVECGVSSVEDKEIMPAPKSDMFGLFDQLESYLDRAEYFRVAQKKPVMWQNLKNMLLRGRWSEQEIRTFRGMLRSLWERSGNN
jgi:tRNA/rRNA methyltransferase